MKGKGVYTWKFIDILGGDPKAIALEAVKQGFTWVAVKPANGVSNYNVSVDLSAIVSALRDVGIKVWGWHYVYGYDPLAEAAKAVEKIRWLNLDGYIIDAEKEWKVSGMAEKAVMLMQSLRAGVGSLPLALSTYRFPTIHAPFPFREFLSYCDYAMPQVYWEQAHNPAEQIDRSLKEYTALGFGKDKFIPAGSAYSISDPAWASTPDDMTAFFTHAAALGLPGAFFWHWVSAVKLPGMWDAIKAQAWPTDDPLAALTAQVAALTRQVAEFQPLLDAMRRDQADNAKAIYSLETRTTAVENAQAETARRVAVVEAKADTLNTGLANLDQRMATGGKALAG